MHIGIIFNFLWLPAITNLSSILVAQVMLCFWPSFAFIFSIKMARRNNNSEQRQTTLSKWNNVCKCKQFCVKGNNYAVPDYYTSDSDLVCFNDVIVPKAIKLKLKIELRWYSKYKCTTWVHMFVLWVTFLVCDPIVALSFWPLSI